jgi:chromosome segregation protein
LRIRSLEIAGFKSFADRVVLSFDRGISAIVGPNGCGKSNVVDAIRWVMGEQNPRHLRGQLMEDVVFNGTESRPPLGMAEVVLTLDASDGRVPPDYAGHTEIQIARRLYRSGESEYLINRVPCRLRDVTEFFLDTGVGVRGYTIVEQGQIASIVSTRPEDRRYFIEEAAGISKYRQRRRESERKLEQTEQNLTRVSDVLGELRRQIGSLDRQARKAARFKELSARLRDLELLLATVDFGEHAARVREQERTAADVRGELEASGARAARHESQLEAARREHLDHERALAESSELLFQLRGEIQALESRVEYERRERDGLLGLAEQREVESDELERNLARERAALASAIEELGFADERVAREQQSVEARVAELRESTERLAQTQGRREALQHELVRLSAEAAAVEARVDALEQRRHALERRLREQDDALETHSTQVEGLGREEEDLGARLRQSLADSDGLGLHLAELLRTHDEETRRHEALRSELADVRERVQERQARLASLRELESRESGRVRELLARIPEHDRRVVRGLLSEVVRVEEGLELALETALAGRLDGVLVDEPGSALALLTRMRDEHAGRLTLVPVTPADAAPVTGFVPLGRALLSAVSAKPPFEPIVRRLLRDVYVVDDLAAAVERYGVVDPPAVFVTPRGELLDRSGALVGGSGPVPGTLQRAAEIRRLEAECEALSARRLELETSVATERQRVEALARELENTRSRRHTAELAVVQLEKDLERARERSKLAFESGEGLRAARATALEERDRLVGEQGPARARLAALARDRGEAERARDRLAEEIAALGREIERVEHKLVERKVELAELAARRDQLRATRERLDGALEEGLRGLARRRDEVAQARARAAALAASTAEAQETVLERIRSEEEIRARQTELRAAYEASARQVEQEEAAARGAARERDALYERLASAELALQEARLRRDQLVERVRERWNVDLASEPPADAAGDEERESRAAEARALREQLEALGDVHLGAIEEYQEVSERHRYLGEQKADLELSIERLRDAISRINRTSRARFKETFDAVDTEFQRIYPRLFRGGRAHLSLTESEDVLEAGIEIHAQPPGKKLQNVNLLSGGEKTLTAIALLLAVFVVKPSPFFLLDEVDAALDDANVGRFNEAIRELVATSQFLMITHNKSSIEIADRLFGVTMQEPGLSKLVTVDLVG